MRNMRPNQPHSAAATRRLAALIPHFHSRLSAFGFPLLLAAAVALPATTGRTAELSPQALEYKVKGGYLFNFAKLSEWPTNALPTPNSPFIIGVLDGGDALAIFQSLLAGKTVNDHPIQFQTVSAERPGSGLHILFVPRPTGKFPEELLVALGGAATLLVGEAEDFAQRGGSLNFITVDGSVKFEANPDAATRAQLKLGSQLLKLARVVKDASPGRKN